MCTDKNKPQGSGEATSEAQKQMQEANMTALTASISKLQQEKNQLKKEKDELLDKLAAKMATKGKRPINTAYMYMDVCFWSHTCQLLAQCNESKCVFELEL